jgi:hypothetical protein
MDKGWVKLHRQMFSNSLWLAEPFTKAQAWVDLFANANYEDSEFFVRGNKVKIKRGQIGWSEITMAKRWGWSRMKVRRYLKQLESDTQVIQQKIHKITTILTIINYDKYQNETTDETSNETTDETRIKKLRNKEDKNNTILADKSAGKSKFNPLGSEIIKAFEEVDPKNKTYYGNTTQRGACDYLLETYGLEEVLKRISVLPKTNKIPYFPKINSPNDLKEKWVKLQDAVEAKRAEIKSSNKTAF